MTFNGTSAARRYAGKTITFNTVTLNNAAVFAKRTDVNVDGDPRARQSVHHRIEQVDVTSTTAP